MASMSRHRDQSNPAMTVLLISFLAIVAFLGVNTALYFRKLRRFPRKPKKRMGAKQMKRQRMTQSATPSD